MVNQYWRHSFARNWQLPFLNQRKGENDHRKYFMIKCRQKNVAYQAGVNHATSRSPVGQASNWATKVGIFMCFICEKIYHMLCPRKTQNQWSTSKNYNKTYITNKYSDHPVHPPSMTRVLVYPSLDSLEAVEGTWVQRRLWSDCANVQADLSFFLVSQVLLQVLL